MGSQNRLSWMIGGPQGSGVDSSARMFALACANGGLYVFGKREYYSNIKGEHSYFQIRVDEREVRSSVRDVQLLGTFEAETLLRHLYAGEVVAGGAAIFDPSDLKVPIEKIGTIERTLREEMLRDLEERGLEPTVGSVVKDAEKNGVRLFEVPYNTILEEVGEQLGVKEFAKLQIIKNTICVGASFGALDYELDVVLQTVDDIFAKKSERVREMNRIAIEKGYKYVQENYGKLESTLKQVKRESARRKLFIQGTQATGMGKIVAGCRFQTYYPITPATDESEYLESHPDGQVVVMQCEDEISAMAMAIGAALAGARSSTSTSGPGFNLMVEAFGWAGINEVPVVLINYQRGGPSTGLPTRHEQGDLKFSLHAGHGDFPRIVWAPGDLEEAFWGAIDAFNWADKYQMPVVFLHDKNMANNSALVDAYEFEKARIDRGRLLDEKEIAKMVAGENGSKYFERFAFEESGVSPRSVLGQAGGIHWTTGDEHDPRGHISEDPENRIRMMNKRMQKLETITKEVPLEKMLEFHGPKEADVTIVSWGSNKGAILDAMRELEADGATVNFLHIMMLAPLPSEEIAKILGKAKKAVLVEQNYTGQLGGWIRQNTGIDIPHRLLKYTGRPITEDEIVDGIRKVLKADNKTPVKEVLTHGV